MFRLRPFLHNLGSAPFFSQSGHFILKSVILTFCRPVWLRFFLILSLTMPRKSSPVIRNQIPKCQSPITPKPPTNQPPRPNQPSTSLRPEGSGKDQSMKLLWILNQINELQQMVLNHSQRTHELSLQKMIRFARLSKIVRYVNVF